MTPSPTVQAAFIYTINPLVVTAYPYGIGASITAVNGEATLATGTSPDGYARLFSNRVVNYRPGQGTLIRGTARFSTPTVNHDQLFGVFNVDAGYRFGYVGTGFGILHTEAATAEIQTLTITAPVAVNGNVTVTLDSGIPVIVPVTVTGSTSITASQIAEADFSQAAGGWSATATANVVSFVRRVAGPAGPSTFAPGATGVVGVFNTPTLGVLPTETFIPQATWSVDTLLGVGGLSNPSGMLLDPQRGNVYQIKYQYLGNGNAFFAVENPVTGFFTPVHIIQNANKRITTVLRNPNGYVSWEARNKGVGTSITLRGASGAGFTEGPVSFLGPQRAALRSRTVSANTETPVLSLRAAITYTGRESTAQIQFDRITVACDGTKTVDFRLYRNPDLRTAVWSNLDASNSIAQLDSSATTLTGGVLVYAFSVGKTADAEVQFETLGTFLQAGDVFTLTALSTNATDVSASFLWVED